MSTHHLAPSTDGRLIRLPLTGQRWRRRRQPATRIHDRTLYLKSNVELHLCSGAKLRALTVQSSMTTSLIRA